ncbi:MAG: EFR1 family ferrodoxin [Spirochaetales bacterium]|nr:EFR1 family ferrodoxin [Spirochaetales bacterium]
MNLTIAYFSGTGNSRFIAENLIEKLPDAELVPIVKVLKDKIPISGKLGIVCPVYMHRLPHIVCDFIESLDNIPYLFLVGVNAGEIGKVFSLTRELIKQKNIHFQAGFSVRMPSNYLPFGEAVSGEEREALYEKALEKTKVIAETVGKNGSFFDRENSFFKTRIHPGLMYSMGYKFIQFLDKSFSAGPECNACSLCADICPVDNIEMQDGKPVWKKHCQQCLACLNYCPRDAIQYGKSTFGLSRYHHPKVSAKKLMEQK